MQPEWWDVKLFYSAANPEGETAAIIPSAINFVTNAIACAYARNRHGK